MPLMLSPAAVVPDSKLRLVIIVFSIPSLAIIRAFGENLLPICSL
jgi:hypothetical protein